MASFFDRTMKPKDKARVLMHLQGCRRCFRQYQEFAIFQRPWTPDSLDVDPIPEMNDTGQLADTQTAVVDSIKAKPQSSRPFWLRWRLQASLAMAAMVVILFSATMLWRHLGPDTGSDYTSYTISLSPIRIAVESVSTSSRFLLPGAETIPRNGASTIRSGYFSPNDSLEESLQRLFKSYVNNTASSDDAYCLIAGRYALGQNELARSIAVSAVKRFSDDAKINIIRAIIAYNYEEKNDTAQVLLRKVLTEYANKSVAGIAGFNLAVILEEQSEREQALKILTELQTRFASTPLGDQVKGFLSGLQAE
jgi:hypothetical protein